MEVYFAPVLLTVLALAAQVRRNRLADVTTLAACCFVMVLLCGLRWYVDADFMLYGEMYRDNPRLGNFNSASIATLYGEPGYLFVTAVFKSLGAGFAALVFACALASLLVKSLVVARLSRHASLALCLYLCLNFVTIEFIQMRWAVATALLASGFYFQYKGRPRAAILSFALSIVFHYFSVVFWVVAVLVSAKGYRRFYLLLAVAIVGAIFLRTEFLNAYLISDSDIYLLSRMTRYASDPDSHVGALSYAKLLMYPAIYLACVRVRPSFPWQTDPLNVFLFKLSLASIATTLLVSFLPVLHFRTTVLADFFAIVWVLNALGHALTAGPRSLAFAGLGILYCTWCVIDVSNSINAGWLSTYQTWFTAPRVGVHVPNTPQIRSHAVTVREAGPPA